MTKEEFAINVINNLVKLGYSKEESNCIVTHCRAFIDYCYINYSENEDESEICAEGLRIRTDFILNPSNIPVLASPYDYNRCSSVREAGVEYLKKRKERERQILEDNLEDLVSVG